MRRRFIIFFGSVSFYFWLYVVSHSRMILSLLTSTLLVQYGGGGWYVHVCTTVLSRRLGTSPTSQEATQSPAEGGRRSSALNDSLNGVLSAVLRSSVGERHSLPTGVVPTPQIDYDKTLSMNPSTAR